VLLPADNEPNVVADLTPEILGDIKITYVHTLDEVLEHALQKEAVTPPIVPQPEPTRSRGSGRSANSSIPDIAPPSPSFDHEADIAEKVIRDARLMAMRSPVSRKRQSERAATAYFLAVSTNPIVATSRGPNAITNPRCASSRITPRY